MEKIRRKLLADVYLGKVDFCHMYIDATNHCCITPRIIILRGPPATCIILVAQSYLAGLINAVGPIHHLIFPAYIS